MTGLSTTIEEREEGGLLIGAGVRNTAVAEHQAVRTRYPVLDTRDPRRSFRTDPQHGHGGR